MIMEMLIKTTPLRRLFFVYSYKPNSVISCKQVVVVPVLVGVQVEVALVTVPVDDERVIRAWL